MKKRLSPMASWIRAAILTLASASAMASHAGVAITQVVGESDGDGRVDTNIIRIEKGKVRIDLGRDPDTYQIYRGDLAVSWTVNLKEKTYVERTGKGAEARTTYRKAGDGGKVGRWPAEKYEGFRKNEKIAEAWVTDAGALGIPASDARALRDMEGYSDKYSSGWPGKDTDEANGTVGLTVKALSYRDGKPVWRTEYAAVKEEACAARLFDLPPGLTLRVP